MEGGESQEVHALGSVLEVEGLIAFDDVDEACDGGVFG